MPNPKRRHSKTRGRKRRTHDALTPVTPGLCPQCLLVGGGNVFAEARERLEEGALVDLRVELPVDRRQHPVEHGARWHPAQLDAFAQPRQFLIDALRVRGQTREHLLGVAALAHRARTQQVGEVGVKTAQRAQAHRAVAEEGLETQLLLQLQHEDVERDPVVH